MYRANEPPIRSGAARQIAGAFRLQVADVIGDAARIQDWSAPGDDLLVALERQHGWPAARAVAYLLSLRNALSRPHDT